MGTSLVRMN